MHRYSDGVVYTEGVGMRNRIRAISMRILDYYTAALNENSIEYWQSFSFYVIAFAGLALSVICIIPGMILLFSKARYAAVAAYLLLFAIDVIVIFVPKPSIKAKTIVLAFNFYIFGLSSVWLVGPVGQRGIGFTASVLLCSLYIGFRASLVFACLDLVTGIAFGVLCAKGLIAWSLVRDIPFATWIVQSMDIFIIDIILAFATSVLIKGAGRSFQALYAAEGRIRASLAEKETLIRELYHRTKNNMQVVSALLKLHSRELESESDRAIFKDVTNKIVAMSLVHQKLYESQDLSNINVAEYIEELVTLLVSSYGSSKERVEVFLDIEDTTMLIDIAVPLGLVISEIVANSLKHAFPDERRGKISVGLNTMGDYMELVVSDDGIGVPEGFLVVANGRMGMKTLFTMVEHQLQGSIQFSSKGGVAYEIRFKRKLYTERV
jgi:two-component sensor histidine kinase